MIHRYKLIVYFLIAALFGVALSLLLYAREESAPILSKDVLSSFGYKTTKNYQYNNLCQKYEQTNPKKVNYQSIKSIKAVKGTKNTYYRFTFLKELYSDEATAISSLEKIKKTKGDSWYSKTCGIKKGVRIKNVLYFLATDVGAFRAEISPVLNKIIDRLEAPSPPSMQ